MKKTGIRSRFLVAALGFLAAGLAASPTAAFSLASQNCLHLGWGQEVPQQNKKDILQKLFTNFDVVVLQEVMAQANLANVTPGNHTFIVTAPQGPGTYKEAYGFLLRKSLTTASTMTSTVPGFSRPPVGILLQAGGNWTWVIDYHAVYGHSIAMRRAEVSRIQLVYQGFQTTVVNGQIFPRAVIGGDWNLAANDQTFQNFILGGWPINVQPTNRTSLKRNGGPSQPYDHFLWDPTAVVVTNWTLIPVPDPPGSDLAWREQVSDHLGIACFVD